jgi:histidyl-tRNA synthetase
MFDCLPGFRDFYPEACARRDHLFRQWTQTARRFGFRRYDIPTLEPLELYTEKSGPEIVDQLFHFTDKGGRAVALRPELTPSLARMIGSQANSLKRPVKWFNIAENFRYEKPQKGRLRAHYQLNADIFGEPGVAAEAEIIALLVATLRACGLDQDDFVVRLSDRALWIAFLAAHGHAGAAAAGILAVVDKLERLPRAAALEQLAPWFGAAAADFLARVDALVGIRDLAGLEALLPALAADAPIRAQIVERLQTWRELLADLAALGVGEAVRIDLGVVRGLAYYTGFVFEVFARAADGSLTGRALAGGGRYDHLVGRLGYPDMPAIGFGMGDVTVGQLLEERARLPALIDVPDLYMVFAGAAAKAMALADASQLRASGWRVEYPLRLTGFAKQFKLAGLSGAPQTLIYGDAELAAGAVKIRDMRSGAEHCVPHAQLGDALRAGS